MNAHSLEHLLNEHTLIRRTLKAFSHYLGGSKGPGTHQDAVQLVVYFEELLFLRHEEKEEVVLLPDLARAGLHWDDGALLHVREDHTRGRYLLDVLKQALQPKDEWSPLEIEQFQRAAADWSEFLTEHMAREEASLFPAVKRFLQPELDTKWTTAFERIDLEVGEMRNSKELQAFGREFLRRYEEEAVAS